MLNAEKYDDLLTCSIDQSKKLLDDKLTKTKISFNNIGEFPEYNGIYFVYQDNRIIYIGKADKQNIKKRCEQYLNKSSGGTLRKKIENTRNLNPKEAIDYIKNTFSVKFIQVDKVEKIPTLEQIAILIYQPRLNALVTSNFSYDYLEFN